MTTAMPRGLLLLAAWALLGALLLQAEARSEPMKLCGREFIRAVIFTCGSSRWRRTNRQARDSLGNFFPDGQASTDNLPSELDEAVGSSEWLALTKSPQAFYGGRPSWQGSPGVVRSSRDVMTSLSSRCCEWGCSKSQISSLC
ncbi:relaxin-3 [Meriones unguiculatus]|uniref:relaxin-3 n=1 Tax=Meriones unguiculatus TaxID=10047 RepID=UPI0010867565|nr:relaxin-3 [Meriones unguiculatus]